MCAYKRETEKKIDNRKGERDMTTQAKGRGRFVDFEDEENG